MGEALLAQKNTESCERINLHPLGKSRGHPGEITWAPRGNHVRPPWKSRGPPGAITWAPISNTFHVAHPNYLAPSVANSLFPTIKAVVRVSVGSAKQRGMKKEQI